MMSTPLRSGLRTLPRPRLRILAGLGLGAVALAGNLAMYSSLDERIEVWQAVRDIPAGARITPGDLAPVRIAADPTLQMIPVGSRDEVVGRFTRTRIVAGALVVTPTLQDTTLVAADAAVVAVRVPEGSLPAGLRERSRVQVVIPVAAPADPSVGAPAPDEGVVPGIVVTLPEPAGAGLVALSIEVDRAAAVAVARSPEAHVVLVEPQSHEPEAP